MNGRRFDELSRLHGEGVSRRDVLRLAVGVAVAELVRPPKGFASLLGGRTAGGQASPARAAKPFRRGGSRSCTLVEMAASGQATERPCDAGERTRAQHLVRSAHRAPGFKSLGRRLRADGFRTDGGPATYFVRRQGVAEGATVYHHFAKRGAEATIIASGQLPQDQQFGAVIGGRSQKVRGVIVSPGGAVSDYQPPSAATVKAVVASRRPFRARAADFGECDGGCSGLCEQLTAGGITCEAAESLICPESGPFALACAMTMAASCDQGLTSVCKAACNHFLCGCPPGQVPCDFDKCCPCPSGTAPCPGATATECCECEPNYTPCVDHCCPNTLTCCVLPDGTGECAALKYDGGNCGACGVACEPGTVCCNEQCVPEKWCCAGVNTDILTDSENCGGCTERGEGEKCASDESCYQGKCVRCPPGQAPCGSQHCCEPGETCCNGACCPNDCCGTTCCQPGEGCCGEQCVPPCAPGERRDPTTCKCVPESVFCGCQGTCWPDEATCEANCQPTLRCFNEICGPAAPGQCP
jgi:hypothetical protein